MTTPDPEIGTRSDRRFANGAEPFSGSELSLVDLLSQLGRDARALLSAEVELFRTEMAEKLDLCADAVLALVVSSLALFSGIGVLIAAGIIALNARFPGELWLWATLVGGGVATVGLAMTMIARKRLRAKLLVPRRTLSNVRRDVAMLHEDR